MTTCYAYGDCRYIHAKCHRTCTCTCTNEWARVWLLSLYSLSLSQILTTHAMEEVDHLCTRIGIRNFGRLCCLGTQNRLKSKINSRKAVQQFETYRNKFFADIYRFVVVTVTY